jgi:hypothetical protein
LEHEDEPRSAGAECTSCDAVIRHTRSCCHAAAARGLLALLLLIMMTMNFTSAHSQQENVAARELEAGMPDATAIGILRSVQEVGRTDAALGWFGFRRNCPFVAVDRQLRLGQPDRSALN